MSRGEQPGWDNVRLFPNAKLLIQDYPSEKSSLPMFFLSMLRLSSSSRFDLIFSSHTHVNAVLSLMRKLGLIRCKAMVSRESTFIFERFFGVKRFIFRFMYRFLYGAQDLLICQTEMMRKSLVNSLSFVPAKRIDVLPNPVNIENVAIMGQEPLSQGMPFDVNIVGCGRLVEIKAFDRLIRGFSLVASRYPLAGLVIIGDGPCREGLQRLVEEVGLASRVFFAGRQDNPINWFSHTDVGVISSVKEGFPNVLLEMMAAGARQVISTPCTDGLASIPNIQLLRDGSVEAIAEGLDLALANRPNMADKYRQYIADNRSVSAFWQKVEALVAS
jgi:glycosyltransferase involved in cell wall biosynthesis